MVLFIEVYLRKTYYKFLIVCAFCRALEIFFYYFFPEFLKLDYLVPWAAVSSPKGISTGLTGLQDLWKCLQAYDDEKCTKLCHTKRFFKNKSAAQAADADPPPLKPHQ